MKPNDESPAEAGKEARESAAEGKQEPGSVEELADALALAVRERDDAIARWQRAQADFQNLRRRTQGDIEQAVRRSQQGLLEGLLLAVDQLELALAAPRSGAAAEQLARGVEMTRAQLLRTLAQAGATPMDELKAGDRFDPARHEAVASLPAGEREPGSVIDVVRIGYAFGDQVLRPAQVIVAGAAVESKTAGEGTRD